MTGHRFPLGAAVKWGYCDGVYCITRREMELVADVRIGPNCRRTLHMDLCAGCLTDFVKAGTVLTNVHVFVQALDSLYHELSYDGPPELDGVPIEP